MILECVFKGAIGANLLISPVRLICSAFLLGSAALFGHVSDLYDRLKAQTVSEKNAKEKLEESERRFHAITDLSLLPISIQETNGRYLYVNRKFTELFGYTLDDIPTTEDWNAQRH
jgi:PAS domain-containing protein